ncbi:transposase [Planctomyces bekefii]|uniref:Transposase n=1 Tax=Planctomyces bekefii TaxID=1653850 RepID=A0A5C6M3F9_9PLAN|nr:transposase [Planctomyces bekefii]
MQTHTLKLKSYEIPENLAPEAKDLCQELVGDLEKTHEYYKQQIAFIKQQYKIALRALRPDIVSAAALRSMFDEAEMTLDPKVDTIIEDPGAPAPNPKKKNKKRSAIPDHLPREVVEHDIDESRKTCDADGSTLKPMRYDVKLELKYTPAKFEVIEHRFPKYGCDTCKGAPIRVPPIKALIPQSYATPGLLAQIAVAKFCDHLPLYRQEQIYSSAGVHLTRQVMAEWMIKLGEGLKPLIGLLHERILEAPVVHADETPVKVLTKDGERTSHKAYMWQVSRWGPKPLVVFEFDMSRKKEVAERLLGTYSGFVQIDAYAGYDLLFSETSPRIRVGCMAHVYRKFKDFLATLDKDQRPGHPALKIMKMIDPLYEMEDVCRPFEKEARHAYRLKQGAEKQLDDLAQFVADERQAVSPSSPYYAALRYADDELPHIKHYLKHGAIELDNNLAENAIRPFALGRKNWLFMCTEDGAQASANIYSLLITAKANGVEPVTGDLSW